MREGILVLCPVVSVKSSFFAAKYDASWASQVALAVKKPLAGAGDEETQLWSLGREDALEEGMATHLSSLAWRIPWTEEPGGVQSMGSQRVRHD